MNRKNLLTGVASLLIAGTATFAMAQDNGPAPAPTTSAAMAPGGHGMKGMHDWKHRGDRRHHGMHRMHGMHGMRGHHGPSGEVIGDLLELQRLYTMQGKSSELPALYQDVLGKTQDPLVRNFVQHQIARNQLRPSASARAQAITTLRKNMDENIARLNAMPKPSAAAPTNQ